MHYEPLDHKNWALWRRQITMLESTVYEASRQDNPETLRDIICHSKSASFIAHNKSTVAGFCLGGPIELFPHVRGPSEDSTRGHFQTLYSADTCVAPIFQGRGIARELKLLQRTSQKQKDIALSRVAIAQSSPKKCGDSTVRLARDRYI